MKTANEQLITFNEPIIYFYLIKDDFSVYTFPFSRTYIKIKSQR